MDLQSRAVLVVDDAFAVRQALSMLLKSSYKVTTANNGEEGIQCLEKEHFDVVILDIEMPGLSGLETLAQIKKRWPQVQVIIATAHGTLEYAQEAMSKGAFDFISKPFDVSKVLDVVRKAFAGI